MLQFRHQNIVGDFQRFDFLDFMCSYIPLEDCEVCISCANSIVLCQQLFNFMNNNFTDRFTVYDML